MPSERWIIYKPHHYFGLPWHCTLVNTGLKTHPNPGQRCLNCAGTFKDVDEAGFWIKYAGNPHPVHLACAFLELIGGPNLDVDMGYHGQALQAFHAYLYTPQELPGLFPNRSAAQLTPYEPLIGFGALVEDESKFT